MHPYHACSFNEWRSILMVHEVLVSRPKPQRVIGKKRRDNNTTIPPLDFRLCFASLFHRTEDQNCARESSAGDSSRPSQRTGQVSVNILRIPDRSC